MTALDRRRFLKLSAAFAVAPAVASIPQLSAPPLLLDAKIVSLNTIRSELLPGLWKASWGQIPAQWDQLFNAGRPMPAKLLKKEYDPATDDAHGED